MNQGISGLYARDPESASLMRRRALAQQLMQGANQTPMRTAAGPWSAVIQALAGGVADVVTAGQERELGDRRRAEANDFMASALGGMPAAPASPATPAAAPNPDAIPARQAGGFTPVALATNARDESDGDDAARNPRSSATGRHQFIDSTWLEFARQNPQLFGGATTPAEILARRADGGLQDQAAQWYAMQNGQSLSGAGLPVNDTNLALAHRFGPQGATQVLQANPATPIADVVGPRVMQANPDLAGRTVGEVQQRYAARFGGGASTPAAAPPASEPPPQAAPGMDRQRLVMAALRGLNSTNPLVQEQARNLLAAAQALPQAGTRQFATAAPGSAILDPQTGRVIGQVPSAEDRTLETIADPTSPTGYRRVTRAAAEGQPVAAPQGVNVNVPVNTERTLYGEMGQRAGARLDAMREGAGAAVERIRSGQRILGLLEGGAITGTGAGMRESIERAFATAGLVDGRRVANTGQLMAELANQTLEASGALRGPTSDRDIMFLREAAAGRIELTPDTIRRVVQVSIDRGQRDVGRYNDIANSVQNDPNAPALMRQIYAPITLPTPDAQPTQQQPGGIARPRTREEMSALPSGTVFYAPDGSLRRVP